MAVSDLLISFYGDDFTGSTDAMESLAIAGVRTVLFTDVPTLDDLAKYPSLRAFGIAGQTRAMPPDQMERTLRHAFAAMKQLRPPIVHYKVCSTFDSSPTVGSIGRAIDVGAEVFGTRPVPVVVGAPALGRYCVFGNLFARVGKGGPILRLDRHPSMSRHPVTPMDEADLRLHLAKQTTKSIGLIDVLDLADNDIALEQAEEDVVLIDLLHDDQLASVGRLIDAHARRQRGPRYVVGSSGVEAALAAHWKTPAAKFDPISPAGPILAISGSCSPVTAGQIGAAVGSGFQSVSFDEPDAARVAARALQAGRSVIVHTMPRTRAVDIRNSLARLAREILASVDVRRLLIAGGDTSGAVARALGLRSMEMIGELARGAPLCRVTAAPGSPADGMEMCFKGGQIGGEDFFEVVRTGRSHG